MAEQTSLQAGVLSQRDKTILASLIGVYAYHQAQLFLASLDQVPQAVTDLVGLLVERRELNVVYLVDREEEFDRLLAPAGLTALANDPAGEQVVNYIMDLEAKLKTGQIIDFVRAVSPVIYRLYLRLLRQSIPDLDAYINNAKNDQYDRWRFDQMAQSDHPAIQAFISRKRDSRVTSKSLLDLLEVTDQPEAVKAMALALRQFEKSVRNPLAHLIQAFDEEELHRTTGFSSQVFLEKIIQLAQASGLVYDSETFYFDQVNRLIIQSC